MNIKQRQIPKCTKGKIELQHILKCCNMASDSEAISWTLPFQEGLLFYITGGAV